MTLGSASKQNTTGAVHNIPVKFFKIIIFLFKLPRDHRQQVYLRLGTYPESRSALNKIIHKTEQIMVYSIVGCIVNKEKSDKSIRFYYIFRLVSNIRPFSRAVYLKIGCIYYTILRKLLLNLPLKFILTNAAGNYNV